MHYWVICQERRLCHDQWSQVVLGTECHRRPKKSAEESAVCTVMTGGQMKSWPRLARWWHTCVKCVQFCPLTIYISAAKTSRGSHLSDVVSVKAGSGKETQRYQRAWFFNQATNRRLGITKSKNGVCCAIPSMSLRRQERKETRMVMRAMVVVIVRWGLYKRSPPALYFSDPSPLSCSNPSGPWPYSPNNVRLWWLAS